MDTKFDILSYASSESAFKPDDLRPFSIKQLKALRAHVGGGKAEDEKVREFLDNFKLTADGLNTTEIGMVTAAISAADTGINIGSSPYEEKMIPKKGTVQYTASEIVLTAKDGVEVRLPNLPLAPSVPVERAGIERVALFLASTFDFKKGELVTIRDPTVDTALFGSPQTAYAPAGLISLAAALRKLVQAHTRDQSIFKEKETLTGHAMTDWWYTFLNSLPIGQYLSLNVVIVQNCLKGVTYQPGAKGKQPVFARTTTFDTQGTEVVTPGPTSAKHFTSFSDRTLPGSAAWSQSSTYAPILWTKPLDPRALMWQSITAPRNLLILYKDSMALRGGNSRGVGLMSQYMDYCPRQSETIRRLNFFVMAIANVHGKCDVHIRAGDVSLLVPWLKRELTSSKNVSEVRLLASQSATKGLDRPDFMIEFPRPGMTQVAIVDFLLPPEITSQAKKKGGGEVEITVRATQWRSYVHSLGPCFIMSQWWSPEQVEGLKTTQFAVGRGHDLMAIFTNLGLVELIDPVGKQWRTPILWDSFAERCRVGIKMVNAWHISGEPIFNSLGQWFTPPPGEAQIVDGEWQFTESEPYIPVSLPAVGWTAEDFSEAPDPPSSQKGSKTASSGSTTTSTTTIAATGQNSTKVQAVAVATAVPAVTYATEIFEGDESGEKDSDDDDETPPALG